MTLWVGLWVALLSAAPADAIKAADAAMNAADFAAALKLLDGIDKDTASRLELERVGLLRAECLSTLKRPEEADAAFADAIRLNPAVRLSPNAPSRLLAALERVRAGLVGTVTLRAGGTDAMALVDGDRVGPLPVSIPLLAGKHLFRVDSAGAVSREVVVKGGQSVEVVLEVPAPPIEPAPVVIEPAPATSPTNRAPGMVLLAAGGVVAVTGAALFGTSFSWKPSPNVTITEAKVAHDTAELQHHVGLGLLGAGAAAAVAGLIVILAGSADAPSTAVVVPIAGGAVFSVAGSF